LLANKAFRLQGKLLQQERRPAQGAKRRSRRVPDRFCRIPRLSRLDPAYICEVIFPRVATE